MKTKEAALPKKKLYVGYDAMFQAWEVHTSLKTLKNESIDFYFEVLVPHIKYKGKVPVNIGSVEIELLDLAA